MCPRKSRASDRRLVDMSAVPSQTRGAWAPELPAEDEWIDIIPISETVSYLLRYETDQYNRIVEFAVIQRTHEDGDVRRVALYDSCHGKGVHVHYYDRDEREIEQHPLRPVTSYEELESGMDYAIERVSKDWEENERRSRRGNGGATAR
ncbi:hypothetical protein GCM10009613_61470 [Pseudonocardia kongjuensis]|uniref:WYL domain-containing protein n=1 Tax=Pseudonocardia kongjuensis TaxID=102227 RepID=A0ABN1YC24_9PSEU